MVKVPRYKQRKDQPREDKSVLWMPRCPFCGALFSPPEDIFLESYRVFGGKCGCGAVYTCDTTGRNQGEAFMDALALAAGSYQDALSFDESEYEEVVLTYDIRKHRLIPKGPATLGMRFSKLVFIRLNKMV